MIQITTPTTNFPAMQGMVGNRLATYATQLPPHAVEGLLGHDPRSRHWKKLPGDIEAIYSKVQRATAGQRLRGIMDYIRFRFAPGSVLIGAFPAVSIAVQNHVTFREVDAPNLRGVGNIEIDMSSRNARIVVDGLGRLSGVFELLEQSYDLSNSEEERDKLNELLNSFSIPVVIYAPHPDAEPLNRAEMGQLFFDFNFKAVKVPDRIAISLDMSDVYIQATNALAKECEAIKKNGGMEERAASLGKKSTALVVQQVLLRFVRGAMEGPAFQESNKDAVDDPHLTLANLRENVGYMADFIDSFAKGMGENFSKDRKSMYLSSPGWQTIGVIYHDLIHTLKVPEPLKTAEALGALDWSRESDLWQGMMVKRQNKETGQDELVLNSAGASTKREMVKRVRAKLGIDTLLADAVKKVSGAAGGDAEA